jgi:hypothetical protein
VRFQNCSLVADEASSDFLPDNLFEFRPSADFVFRAHENCTLGLPVSRNSDQRFNRKNERD